MIISDIIATKKVLEIICKIQRKHNFFRPPLLMWFIVREGALIQGFQESLNL